MDVVVGLVATLKLAPALVLAMCFAFFVQMVLDRGLTRF